MCRVDGQMAIHHGVLCSGAVSGCQLAYVCTAKLDNADLSSEVRREKSLLIFLALSTSLILFTTRFILIHWMSDLPNESFCAPQSVCTPEG